MASIFIFNSNEDRLEGISEVLVQAGHETTSRLVSPSTTVGDMAELLRTHVPDVVVYDLQPPFEESLVAWRDLCAQPDIPDVCFVLTTMWPQVLVTPSERAVVAVLREPFSFDEVVSAVQMVLRRDGATEARSSGGR
jgi:DNA-binding response OmpR family regulator